MPPAPDAPRWIVFFDGNCGLCTRSVRTLHHLDVHDHIHYAPLQGETAARYGFQATTSPDTMVIMRLPDATSFTKSSAWIECLRAIGGLGALLAPILHLIPVKWRDCFYDAVAKRRHRFFPPADTCAIPDARLSKKLLP